MKKEKIVKLIYKKLYTTYYMTTLQQM